MATATRGAKKQVQGIEGLLAASGCTGSCVYKYDPGTGTYVLVPGSTCTGTGCAGCSTKMPSALWELVIAAGPSVFPDPLMVNLTCGAQKEVIVERLLTTYVDCLKLQKSLKVAWYCCTGWASWRRGCSAAFFT